MTILKDLSVLWSLFHVLILFMLLYRSRFSRKKTIILTGITMGPLLVLTMTGLAYFGTEVMGKIFMPTVTLPSLIFFWFMSKDKNGKFIFTFCMADTIALWLLSVTKIVDFYFGGEQYVIMFIGRLVLFPLVESVAGGWGLFAGMTALYYVLLAVSCHFPVYITQRPKDLPVFMMILVLMPLTYATMMIAMYRQLLLFRKQRSERALQEQKNRLKMQLDNQQSIRKMKHDMKGYTATLAGLLAAGNAEEAAEYLTGIEQKMDTLSGQFCANAYIDATLAFYHWKLQELSADCRMDI